MAEQDAQFWHYLDPEGQEHGPVTADELQALAMQGIVHPETNVWTEGLDEWFPATRIEGLLPEAAPQPDLGTGNVASEEEPAAAPTSGPDPVEAQPEAEQIEESPASPELEGHYPRTPTKRASFGTILVWILGGCALAIGGPIFGALTGADPDSGAQPAIAAVLLPMIMLIAGFILIAFGKLFALIALHRSWALLKWGEPRTTPGRAVGFLFIPIFNLYWFFIAHYGLAKDWNRIMASFPDLQSAPRLSVGMALAACICIATGIAAPIGIILLMIYYSQICSGINFMAEHAMHETRAAGFRLY